jgi:hypothetical protein
MMLSSSTVDRVGCRLETAAKLIAVGLLESAVVALDHALGIDLPEERHASRVAARLRTSSTVPALS